MKISSPFEFNNYIANVTGDRSYGISGHIALLNYQKIIVNLTLQ